VKYVLSDALEAPGFDALSYSELLKARGFWERVPFERVLLVQDDSVIARPGLESSSEIMASPYVGAPWEPHDALRPYVGDRFVGNGGLSLRSVAVMRAIAEELAPEASTVFANGVQVLPEDVFFSMGVLRQGRTCPERVAEAFSAEMRSLDPYLDGARPLPFGFHKVWAYHPESKVRALFRRYSSKS
jgi:hypothetical protein